MQFRCKQSGLVALAVLLMSVGATFGDEPASAPNFRGTYSDKTLTVKLVSGFAGWTGTVKKGETEFIITKATTHGAKMTGKFTHGADSFDFDATLDGETLQFSTGGETYTLTRANPPGK